MTSEIKTYQGRPVKVLNHGTARTPRRVVVWTEIEFIDTHETRHLTERQVVEFHEENRRK